MNSNTCRYCMHIIEITWNIWYDEWNFGKFKKCTILFWSRRRDCWVAAQSNFEVKLSRSRVLSRIPFNNGKRWDIWRPRAWRMAGKWLKRWSTIVSIHWVSSTVKFNITSGFIYLAFDIIDIVWQNFDSIYEMQYECTLYKSSKPGLCLDLMILSKLSKACQNFYKTNWNIKRFHFVCWRWFLEFFYWRTSSMAS